MGASACAVCVPLGGCEVSGAWVGVCAWLGGLVLTLCAGGVAAGACPTVSCPDVGGELWLVEGVLVGASACTVCVPLGGCDVSEVWGGAWVTLVVVGLALTGAGEADVV
ncbi:hypothetical protein [Microvirga zambiensis]|uniref:hypothetical protein n=1 Tax=Microvirga zambiensis TaxID=1402137 RepID=UPI00191CBA83|nr:hypothetical protein [Microvirga zambiensis]